MTPQTTAADDVRLVQVTINGEKRSAAVEPRMLLADFIRHELGMTGTHVGCEHGMCGACTVVLNGEIVRSCITFAVQAEGAEIETIESVADGTELHPIQQAFRENHGLQCGFCTPGFILTVRSLLAENPDPSDEEIREYLAGNVCRCTGYNNIIKSVKAAARSLQAESVEEKI